MDVQMGVQRVPARLIEADAHVVHSLVQTQVDAGACNGRGLGQIFVGAHRAQTTGGDQQVAVVGEDQPSRVTGEDIG
jgi:hypothetical protein